MNVYKSDHLDFGLWQQLALSGEFLICGCHSYACGWVKLQLPEESIKTHTNIWTWIPSSL